MMALVSMMMLFLSYNATAGKLLWKIYVGGRVSATPTTYSLDGRQQVAVAAGSSIFTFALPAETRRDTSAQ
jgi:alcohol dehydrogenase (cytochrome c)